MAAQDVRKLFRTKKNKFVEDRGTIEDMAYNEVGGAYKNIRGGAHLVPINLNGTDKTTDASTIRALPKGVTVYIYNTSLTTTYSVRFSNDPAAAALAAGAVDATTHDVGVACKPGDYTVLTNYDKQYIITNNAALLVYMLLDGSRLMDESIRA